MNNKIIQHVKVHLPHQILPSATVWISNGKLKRIEPTQEIETIVNGLMETECGLYRG